MQVNPKKPPSGPTQIHGVLGMIPQPIVTDRRPSPTAGKRCEEIPRRSSGHMILCLGALPHAEFIERYFQERGWNVFVAQSASAARSLSRSSRAPVAVLAEEVPGDESGWLTTWKLLHDNPKAQVVVVGTGSPEKGFRLAELVGASAYVADADPAVAIGLALGASEKKKVSLAS